MKALQQDPDATEVLGRQPALVKWIPSNPFAWYGSIIEGQRFTRQQIDALISRGMDPVTVPAMTVKRQARREEHWFSTRELAPRFEMECPIIGKVKDGRVRVIAPIGDPKLVQPDGWSHRPFRLPDFYRLEAA